MKSQRKNAATLVAILLALALSIPFALEADAGPFGRGRGRGRGGPASPTGGLPRGDTPSSRLSEPLCKIVRMVTTEDDPEDDDYRGYLLAKPLMRGQSVVRLMVPTLDRLSVTIPDHEFEIEDYPELLAKGLNCRVKWEDTPSIDHPSRTSKKLTQIEFCVVEVEGTLKQIADDTVRLLAKPVDGAPWPHLLEKVYSGSRTAGKSDPSRLSRPLIVRFRVIDDLTRLVDEDNWEVGLSDFEEGWKVRASVILGQPKGVLLQMKPVFESDNSDS